ncbi:hypothetical protein M3G18_00825 [Corynebacterium sp. p3-SID1145]|uniref:hypothetical protein n=1 Tax=unclassified Corynebacterium TaxID=2624378 RepID=UPI0021AAC084|nr:MULTISPECIES: hypothetical protein [unclassified Corynebacterium]MCT1451469.1 hypothetical protein [Corynebacterium sp. p3-SID1145]MCT1460524.1 hypothetical protein [Corynebacterium sp. p3-SID1140]
MTFSATPAIADETTQNNSDTAAGEGTADAENEADEENDKALDPTKGLWDNNSVSSESGKDGIFGSSGLNRADKYFKSNQFKTISMIVSVIAGVITVGSQLAAIIITVSPTAKAQFEAFMKNFG